MEEYNEAFVLSMAAQKFMDTVVVRDHESSTILYRDRRVKCLSLDRIVKFRGRSEHDIERGRLPLPSLEGVEGNPRYMVKKY